MSRLSNDSSPMSVQADHPVIQPGSRIPSLDGLRAVSIVGVLFAHGIGTLSEDVRHPLTEPGERAGSVGVLFFFVISGYLITTLLRKEFRRNGRIDLVGFYRRRILRIFPAFYSYVLAIIVLTTSGLVAISRSEIAVAATHLWNYGGLWLKSPTDDGRWFLGHFWTLSLEEQFYLLWPFTICVAGFQRAAPVAIAVCVLAPVLRVVGYALFPQARGMLLMMLPTGADAIMFGCVAALLEGDDRFEKVARRVATPLGALISLAVLLLVCTPLTFVYRGAWTLPIGRTLDAACVTVVVLAMTRWPESALGRILNTRPLVHVGVLSYSLYLWQQLFLTNRNTTWTGQLPLNLLCSYAAALVSYHLIERPFLALKDRRRNDCKRQLDLTQSPPASTTAPPHDTVSQPAASESGSR